MGYGYFREEKFKVVGALFKSVVPEVRRRFKLLVVY